MLKILFDWDTNKCFDKDKTEYLDKYHNKRINKYKAKLINKQENTRSTKPSTSRSTSFNPYSGSALASLPCHPHSTPTPQSRRSYAAPTLQQPALMLPSRPHHAAPVPPSRRPHAAPVVLQRHAHTVFTLPQRPYAAARSHHTALMPPSCSCKQLLTPLPLPPFFAVHSAPTPQQRRCKAALMGRLVGTFVQPERVYVCAE